jgi:Phosphatidylglycerophosphate synthase
MLGKLREVLDNYLTFLANNLNKVGITPNHVTLTSIPFCILASLFYYYKIPLIAGIFLMIMGFIDILDGSLARITHKESLKGAILDTTLDRFTENIPIIFLGISSLANWLLVSLTVFFTTLPSFIRAKIEGLLKEVPITVKYSIGERGERLLVLILLSLIYPLYNEILNIALIIIIILALYATFLRVIYILKQI